MDVAKQLHLVKYVDFSLVFFVKFEIKCGRETFRFRGLDVFVIVATFTKVCRAISAIY